MIIIQLYCNQWNIDTCHMGIHKVKPKFKNQLQGNWKQVENMLKISENLCKLVEM